MAKDTCPAIWWPFGLALVQPEAHLALGPRLHQWPEGLDQKRTLEAPNLPIRAVCNCCSDRLDSWSKQTRSIPLLQWQSTIRTAISELRALARVSGRSSCSSQAALFRRLLECSRNVCLTTISVSFFDFNMTLPWGMDWELHGVVQTVGPGSLVMMCLFPLAYSILTPKTLISSSFIFAFQEAHISGKMGSTWEL